MPSSARRPLRRAIALASLVSLTTMSLAGCGSEATEDEAKTAVLRSVQTLLDEAGWGALVSADAELGKLVAQIGMPFQSAGRVEAADGRTLHWAEYADGADAVRTKVVSVFRRCDAAGTCVVGQASHTANGAAIVDGAGKTLTTLDLGEPVLHKTLKNHNLTRSETVLRLELKRKHIVDRVLAKTATAQLPNGTRKLLIVSAYGPEVGVPLTTLQAAAKATGVFDEVEVIAFARRTDLLSRLPLMTPQDMVIWFGAGVLEPFSDKASKSVGMTLSRGVFGDELIHRNHTKGLLDAPILGGPGLILLAGSNSLTSDHTEQTGLMAADLHQGSYRPVVGFDGTLTPATAEAGAMALLKELAAGKTLSVAMKTGSAAAKATMTTMLTAEQANSWLLPAKKSEFWGQAPKSGSLKLYLKNSPKCVTLPSGSVCTEQGFKTGQAVPSDQLTAAHVVFSCDLTFDGPWLSCADKNDATGADFALRGVMTGQKKGDYVLITATGAPSKKMTQVTIVGAGVIEEASDAKGTLTLKFAGNAAGSTWLDGQGRCCIAVTPLLTGNQSQRSVLTVKR
ncbi:MAG: hypothetical protein KC502_03920 [Myxococcales bacterium]|nr:hypothetical protein [Myxococcales bacterium]